jgi:uncharacterized protein (DUF736 family)
MAVIGTFVSTKEGGWAGAIRTLLLDVKIRFVPNDNRTNEMAPAFRIFAGDCEIGAAWRKQTAGEAARKYLSVRLVDPSLSAPIFAAMFEGSNGTDAQLIWNAAKGSDVRE